MKSLGFSVVPVTRGMCLCGLAVLSCTAFGLTVDLAGDWTLSDAAGRGLSVSCPVPGDNASALLSAGVLVDPFWRENETNVQWIGECGWNFERTFEVPVALLEKRCQTLVFESVDTLGRIELNGACLGAVSNEFRRWQFDVTGRLREKGNRLAVRIAAPRPAASNEWTRLTGDIDIRSWGKSFCREINSLRKCQCSFGWDWGVSLPVSGIYGGVRLVGVDDDRLDYAWAESTLNADGSADVTVGVEAFHVPTSKLAQRAEVIFDGVRKFVDEGGRATFRVSKPELWWPNGMGAQRLYPWSVTLEGQVVRGRLGIRSVELVREKDGKGESFGFRVNGRDFFAMGADWIPSDAFPARRTSARIRNLLSSAKEANMNFVRVWGGGVYESEAFYDACDEMGLLVWQDAMFACARYPDSDEFRENVRAEVLHQSKRLRGRTSLALWCGDNECIAGVQQPGAWREGYIRNNRAIEAAVRAGDPKAIWWTSSPCEGPGDYRYNETRGVTGDVHYWGVWHGGKTFAGYYDIKPRFCSEFGYQSLPCFETVRTFAEPGDFDIFSPVMERHQKNGAKGMTGNEKIYSTITNYFPAPKDFASALYLSQVQQAVAIETGVAYWRTLEPHCRGTVFWQMNDWWPVASWSSVEYDGRWKPLHYAARRFYALDYDAAKRTEELRGFGWRTREIPEANVRIANVEADSSKSGRWRVTVVADAPAHYVWLTAPEDPAGRFDDNLVDFGPGERTFVFTGKKASAPSFTVRDLSGSVRR